MSYNTDLQSNNTDLQNILSTINSLPPANPVTTGTLTLTGNTLSYITIYYIDSTDTYDSISGPEANTQIVLRVPCLVYVLKRQASTTSGSITTSGEIASATQNASTSISNSVFRIYGDATIDVTLAES